MMFSSIRQAYVKKFVRQLTQRTTRQKRRSVNLQCGNTISALESRLVLSVGAVIVGTTGVDGGLSPGQSSSSPVQMLNLNGGLYFTATDTSSGTELWRVNSSGNASIVEDTIPGGGIRAGQGSSLPGNLTNVNGVLWFTADDGLNGRELWRINRSGQAEMVDAATAGAGIEPGPTSSNPTYLTNVNGTLYFRTDGGRNEFGASIFKLWRINNSDTAESVGVFSGDHLSSLTNLGGVLFFVASDGINGRELWRVNASGVPEIVEDAVPGGGINPGAAASLPSELTIVSGKVYFSANDGTNGWELYRINSEGIAELVEDAGPLGGINPSGSAFPARLTNVGGVLYFRADDGTSGRELWRINNAGLAEMIEDNIPGGGIGPGRNDIDPLNALELRVSGGVLYFTANDGINGEELWRINRTGTAELIEDSVPGGGIAPGSAGNNISSLIDVNGVLYFTASDGTNGRELWRINKLGVAEMVEDSVLGGGINPGGGHSDPEYMVNARGTLYFSATDGSNGREFWRIPASGVAELIEDPLPGGGINPGQGSSSPSGWTEVDGVVYFSADDGGFGRELWALRTNEAPSNITLTDAVSELQEDTSTAQAIRIATISTTDDGLGINTFSLSGRDAESFQIIGNSVFLKAGTRLKSQVKPFLIFSVEVIDLNIPAPKTISAAGYLQITSIVPVILAPAATTAELRPRIVWTSISGAVSYDIWIRNDTTNTARFLTATVATNEYIPTIDLDRGETNLWGRFTVWARSRAVNGNLSAWSAGYAFMVRPRVVFKSATVDFETSRPTFSWQPLSGAASYDIWIDNLSTQTSQQIRITNLTATNWIPSSDLALGKYRAWVRGIGRHGEAGSWSLPFTYNVKPSPNRISPVESTFLKAPEFRWAPVTGAIKYELRIINAETGRLLHRVTQSGTSWTPPAQLQADAISWQVSAIGSGGIYSDFKNMISTGIGGRTLLLSSNVVSSATLPQFSWIPIQGAATYQLFVSRPNTPATAVINVVGLKSAKYQSTLPLAAGPYRVWIRAIDETTGKYGPWTGPAEISVVVASQPFADRVTESPIDVVLLTDRHRQRFPPMKQNAEPLHRHSAVTEKINGENVEPNGRTDAQIISRSDAEGCSKFADQFKDVSRPLVAVSEVAARPLPHRTADRQRKTSPGT